MKTTKSTITLLLIISFVASTIVVPHVLGADDSWATLDQMPTARSSLGATVVNGKLYAVGGYSGTETLGTNEMYNPETDTWTTKASVPTPRLAFGSAAVENRIYVIGGSTTGFLATNINEVYNPSTDTWETAAAMPTSRTYVVANEVNGKIYAMAGCTFPHPSYPTLCNKTEVYDPATGSWTEKAQMPNFTGYGMGENVASAVIDNKIYVVAGETLHIYNTETDSWSQGASVPTPINGGAAMAATTGEAAEKRLYLFGGWDIDLNPLDYTQVYDPQQNVWSYASELSEPRYEHASATLHDRIYVVGGTVGEVGEGYSTKLNEQYTPIGYIPEFPVSLLLPLFLAATLTAVAVKRRLFRPT